MPTVITYPQPHHSVHPSDKYRVNIYHEDSIVNSFVYYTEDPHNPAFNTSYTNFSFEGYIQVEVVRLDGAPIQDVKVLPTKLGIHAHISGNSAFFFLEDPANVAVELDGDEQNSMLVFANPLEEDVPFPGDDNVMYFEPGLHDIGLKHEVPDGYTVYLAGGAYLTGTLFAGSKVSDVTIRGRGIISGEKFGHGTTYPNKHDYDAVNFKDAENVTLEGIIAVDSSHFNFTLRGVGGNDIDNVKAISWWHATDGILPGKDSVVTNCFLKVNDDAIKLYLKNITAINNTIWLYQAGAALQFGWHNNGENTNFVVDGLYVIKSQSTSAKPYPPTGKWVHPGNKAIFGAVFDGSGGLSNYSIRNVYIEGECQRIFGLYSYGGGSISNVNFSNIFVDQPSRSENYFHSEGVVDGVKDITIKNFFIGDKLVVDDSDHEWGNNPLQTHNVENLIFTSSYDELKDSL